MKRTKSKLELAADHILAPTAPEEAEIARAIDAAIEAQGAWRDTTRNAFTRFAAAGRLLTAQKSALAHGQWERWLADHLPAEYQRREGAKAVEAWQRTARNWMRIAEILDHCHPAIIESAQTLGQLFRLAQFIPECLPAPGGGEDEPDSFELVARLKHWMHTRLAALTPEAVRSFPEAVRADLRAQLAPIWEALG